MVILAVNDLYMGHTKLRITGIARTPSPAIGKGLTSVGSVDNEQNLAMLYMLCKVAIIKEYMVRTIKAL